MSFFPFQSCNTPRDGSDAPVAVPKSTSAGQLCSPDANQNLVPRNDNDSTAGKREGNEAEEEKEVEYERRKWPMQLQEKEEEENEQGPTTKAAAATAAAAAAAALLHRPFEGGRNTAEETAAAAPTQVEPLNKGAESDRDSSELWMKSLSLLFFRVSIFGVRGAG